MSKKVLRLAMMAVVLAALSAGAMAQTPTAAPQPWTSLQFLVGTWEGTGSGAPGEGRGGCSIAFDLNRNILVRKNWVEFAPKPGETKGISHQDLLIFFADPGEPRLKAIYFDVEGHVIHYVLQPAAKPNVVVFESEPGTKGPRFRLSYEMSSDGRLLNIFSIAMPGQGFKEYTRGWLVKK
jgi:hypothetical protein